MPERINHLRIGEAIITAEDFPCLWYIEMPGIYRDPMVLKAQVVEVKQKPSFPVEKYSSMPLATGLYISTGGYGKELYLR